MEWTAIIIAIVAAILAIIALILVIVKPGPQGDKGPTGATGPIGPTGPRGPGLPVEQTPSVLPKGDNGENSVYEMVDDDKIIVSDGYVLIFDDMSPTGTQLVTDEVIGVFMFTIINESQNTVTIHDSESVDINGADSTTLPPDSISWILAKKKENNTYTTTFFTLTLNS